MNLHKTTTPTLPELRIDLEHNKGSFLSESLGLIKYLEAQYARHYKIIWTQHNPHLIFLHQHLGIYRMRETFNRKNNKRGNAKALIVSFTGEPAYPFLKADHSFSFYPTVGTNTWFPETLYLVSEEFLAMLNQKPTQQMLANKRIPKSNFCAFIYSNEEKDWPHIQARLDLCAELMQYKKVLCPGRSMNNVQPPDYMLPGTYVYGDFIKGLVRYLTECKFFIAFENTASSRSIPTNIRYITVRIMTAFIAGSIPIYSGYREVAELFNPAAFINAQDFSSHQELVEYVKEVDNSPELTAAYQNAPPILPDSPLHNLHPDKMRPLFLSLAERALKRSSKPFILQPDLILRRIETAPPNSLAGLARRSVNFLGRKISRE